MGCKTCCSGLKRELPGLAWSKLGRNCRTVIEHSSSYANRQNGSNCLSSYSNCRSSNSLQLTVVVVTGDSSGSHSRSRSSSAAGSTIGIGSSSSNSHSNSAVLVMGVLAAAVVW